MFTSIQTLLFATNFSEHCRPALETAKYFSEQYGVRIILLHVIDRSMPVQIDEHFKGVLGEKKWEIIKKEHEQDARDSLIGKMSSGKIVKKVLTNYRNESGVDGSDINPNWHEVVVSEKNIARTIIDQAKEHGCDLIILGSRRSFLGGGHVVGSKIKQVLQKSEIPVLVVPA